MKLFDYFKLHIVQFQNDKFAVRKKNVFGRHIYIDRGSDFTWTMNEHVLNYCTVDTLEEARKILFRSSLTVKTVYNG